jgi:hypothetical protein
MKKAIFMLLVVANFLTAHAQKYFTKNASISFNASGPLEEIQSKNASVGFLLNTETGEIQTSALVKSFVFEKQLMQEHFNENYMESEKYPKSTFKGTIKNNAEINYSKDGSYTLNVIGKLTLHGVTKDVNTSAKMTISAGKITVESQFTINCSDYGISIPGAVKEKVSNQVKIAIKGSLDKM